MSGWSLILSEMENGVVEISVWALPFLASALDKPISYFYPAYVSKEDTSEKLNPLEQEALIHFRNIYDDHLQKIAINQLKVFVNFDQRK